MRGSGSERGWEFGDVHVRGQKISQRQEIPKQPLLSECSPSARCRPKGLTGCNFTASSKPPNVPFIPDFTEEATESLLKEETHSRSQKC